MTNTLSDILLKNIGHNLYFDLTNEQIDNICRAMLEAIKEDRKNVANYAKIIESVGFSQESDFTFSVSCERDYDYYIDKNSIINAPIIKLK